MSYSLKGFFEINEDMVQILLMLEILFTQNSKLTICSVVLLTALNPTCSSAIRSLALGLSQFKMTLSMILLGCLMRLKRSVILAEL